MKKMTILLSCLFIYTVGFAQQEPELTPVGKLEQQIQSIEENIIKLQKFKVSGYIQTQFQYGERDASLKIGSANEN